MSSKKHKLLVTVVGARPQFVKIAPLHTAFLAAGFHHQVLHTGQHYDLNMSDIFFRELNIPKARFHLGVGGFSHGAQTGRMLEKIEAVFKKKKPDAVIVVGDTDSTLAGALAAAKMHIPLAHVEAGLRSYNWTMPEEINRVLTDHAADLLFCPTTEAKKNLRKEGIETGVFVVGDIMIDNLKANLKRAEPSQDVKKIGLNKNPFFLLTIHRPANADVPENLVQIFEAIEKGMVPTVFPCHPRTREKAQVILQRMKSRFIRLIEPQGFLSMLWLIQRAHTVITDSGGLQKEAYTLKRPCITVRPETEWVETLKGGWNQLVDAEATEILRAIARRPSLKTWANHYGNGQSAKEITKILKSALA